MALAAGDHPHNVGDEDLSRRSGGAQPRGFDHRQAVEIAVLAGRSTGGNADADLDSQSLTLALSRR